DLFQSFSDVPQFAKVKAILDEHVTLGCVDELPDRWVVNKLGVIWHGNLQTDYMNHALNLKGKVLLRVISEDEANFAKKERFAVNVRSEEHMSELQSLRHLVCRLLLEKK